MGCIWSWHGGCTHYLSRDRKLRAESRRCSISCKLSHLGFKIKCIFKMADQKGNSQKRLGTLSEGVGDKDGRFGSFDFCIMSI